MSPLQGLIARRCLQGHLVIYLPHLFIEYLDRGSGGHLSYLLLYYVEASACFVRREGDLFSVSVVQGVPRVTAPHLTMASITGLRLMPNGVKEYSTRGGTSA